MDKNITVKIEEITLNKVIIGKRIFLILNKENISSSEFEDKFPIVTNENNNYIIEFRTK